MQGWNAQLSYSLIELLDQGQIDLWLANFAYDDTILQWAESLLSDEERDRVSRFATEKLRAHFAVRRALLRHILGRYLDIPPAQLSFDYDAHGKPFLPDYSIRFNLSHSEQMVLIGVTQSAEIGVDIEARHTMPDMPQVARTVYTDKEIAQFHAHENIAVFYTLWTRKEAIMKADGRGFALPPKHIDLTTMQQTHHLPNGEPVYRVGKWSLIDLYPNLKFAGAVAWLGTIDNIRFGTVDVRRDILR